MPAISDSSPLILYSRIGRLEILRAIFFEILIPPAVHDEIVRAGSGRHGAVEVSAAPWIRVCPITLQERVAALSAALGRGEAEAIALAAELGGQLPLLLDDNAGRRIARGRGLGVLGSARVLVLAKQRGLILVVRPLLDDLRSAGLYLSTAIYQELLTLAHEEPTDVH